MSEKVWFGNRFGGEINAVGAFVTHRHESQHLFRSLNGLGFNSRLLLQLVAKGKPIWVFYHTLNGEQKLLKTTPEQVLRLGTPWRNHADIKDNQIIMPLKNFEGD